jgi:hypothetical protein
MQVSFSETFNIATADAVWSGVPVVVSPEVEWIATRYAANPNSITEQCLSLRCAEIDGSKAARRNLKNLIEWNERALYAWKMFLTIPKTKGQR